MNNNINWIAEFMTEDPDVFCSEDRTPPPRDWNAGISDRNKSLNTGGGSRLMKEGERIERIRRQRADAVDAERRAEDPEGREDSEGRKIDPTNWERMTTQDQVSNARKMRHAQGGEVGGEEGEEGEEGSEVEGGEVEGGEAEDKKLSPPVARAANIIADTPGLEAALKSINSPDKLKQLVVAIMMSKQLAHLDKKTVFKGLKNTIADFGEVMREIGKTPEGGEAEGGEAEGGEAEGGEAEGGEAEVEGGEVAPSV